MSCISDDDPLLENSYIIVSKEMRSSLLSSEGSLIKGNYKCNFISADISDSELDEDRKTIIFYRFFTC